jgi:hypothetical protein
MRLRTLPLRTVLAGCFVLTAAAQGKAAEYAFSSYGLGGAAFGAGVTPPPGTYLTTVSSYYAGDIGSSISFGGVTINAGSRVEAYFSGLNVLYVPQTKLFGGSLGLAVTIPVGHIDLDATLGVGPFSLSRGVDGWGLGDIVSRAQLGWQHGEFAHTAYVQAVAPTGKWDPGFSPIIGLHRPGIDTGWSFTWNNKATKLQFNGTAGVTFNFENTETDYKTGNEFHFEWAIGYELAPGFVLGVVGYDYRQLTGDSGSGARLGPLKGRVDAVGPGLSTTTVIGTTPVILNLRHYQEFNVDKRWEGNSTIASGTIRF